MSVNNAYFPTSVWDSTTPGRSSDRHIDRSPNYEDWDQIVAEVIAVQESLIGELTDAQAGATVEATAPAVTTAGRVQKTVFTFTATPITATNGGVDAAGGVKLFDFPEGNLLLLGVVGNLVFTAGAGIDTDAAMVASIGTAVATNANATLTSTEADIVASTVATLTTSAVTLNLQNTATVFLDGTAGAKDVYLNVAVPDADTTATGVVSVTGSLTLTWINLGDN